MMMTFIAFFIFFIMAVGVVADVQAETSAKTKLYLVSIGNGDPDNITLRAVNTSRHRMLSFAVKRK